MKNPRYKINEAEYLLDDGTDILSEMLFKRIEDDPTSLSAMLQKEGVIDQISSNYERFLHKVTELQEEGKVIFAVGFEKTQSGIDGEIKFEFLKENLWTILKRLPFATFIKEDSLYWIDPMPKGLFEKDFIEYELRIGKIRTEEIKMLISQNNFSKGIDKEWLNTFSKPMGEEMKKVFYPVIDLEH